MTKASSGAIQGAKSHDFFLIHGGWQGGWCWDGVAEELRHRGHRVVAPTLPGLGVGARDRSSLGLRDFVAHAIESFDESGFTDAVVVGHSGGGPVGQGLVEHRHDSVRMIGFMDATVLFHGETLLDVGNPERRAELERIAAQSPDNSLPMPEQVWVEQLCCDADPVLARAWLARVVPTPFGWATHPADTPTEAWRKLRQAYIFLADEKPSAVPIYKRMAERLVNPIVLTCAGSHEAMLTRPFDVADALIAIAGY